MPPVSKIESEHRRRRWSAYLNQYVGNGCLTPTALNNRLGTSHAVSRVSAWLKGHRGLEEDTAWEVGRILRDLGADTNEIEAIWAAGFFGSVIRLLQHIAAEPDNGTRLAIRLFSLLPSRMLSLETTLCQDVANVEHGAQSLKEYHQLARGKTLSHTSMFEFTWGTDPVKLSAAEQRTQDVIAAVYAPERFALYLDAWERVTRADHPLAGTPGSFRGDDDVIDIAVDAALRMKERWLPSLLIVRLWQIMMMWADELAPADVDDFMMIPDLFLPRAVARARKQDVDAYFQNMADSHAYDRWRGK